MTLARDEIQERINRDVSKKPIIVTPLLDRNTQIGPCGIDVRLGKQFIIFNENIQDVFSFDLEKNKNINVFHNEIVLSMGDSIIIHPGKVVIASTFEYVSIPVDLECQVEGRSSWARLGLVIATASTIEPGYKGMITLELSNIGKIPITLYPGLRIAQLLFHTTIENKVDDYSDPSKKKYVCNIGPRISKLLTDKDTPYFTDKENFKRGLLRSPSNMTNTGLQKD
jgi:dCTP deaminase